MNRETVSIRGAFTGIADRGEARIYGIGRKQTFKGRLPSFLLGIIVALLVDMCFFAIGVCAIKAKEMREFKESRVLRLEGGRPSDRIPGSCAQFAQAIAYSVFALPIPYAELAKQDPERDGTSIHVVLQHLNQRLGARYHLDGSLNDLRADDTMVAVSCGPRRCGRRGRWLERWPESDGQPCAAGSEGRRSCQRKLRKVRSSW